MPATKARPGTFRFGKRPQPAPPRPRSKWENFDDWIWRSGLGSDAAEMLRADFFGRGAEVDLPDGPDAEDE